MLLIKMLMFILNYYTVMLVLMTFPFFRVRENVSKRADRQMFTSAGDFRFYCDLSEFLHLP